MRRQKVGQVLLRGGFGGRLSGEVILTGHQCLRELKPNSR